MRIRKRFPFSTTASSVSDPQPNNSTMVQQSSSRLHPIQNMAVQHNPTSDSQPSDPPSDQKPIITLHPDKSQINQKEEEEASTEQNGSNNKTRKEYNFLAVAPVVGETGVSLPLGSHQDGMWFDGDDKMHLNKRKGAVEETGKDTMLEEEKKVNPKMKSKKCTTTSGMQQSHNEQDKTGNHDSSSNPNNNSGKKMNKRGGEIMEGSRCSRVNGRGWRCGQQTLVGYSLCEHHLGKGRLRSISNVKARPKGPGSTVVATTVAPKIDTTESTTTNSTTINDNQSSKNVIVPSSVVQPPVRERKDTVLLNGCYDDDDEDEDDGQNEDEDDVDYNEDDEMKKPVVVKKKRMKLGMVKARSLSSLLNQTN